LTFFDSFTSIAKKLFSEVGGWIVVLIIVFLAGGSVPAFSFPSILEQSSLSGTIRSYFQARKLDLKADESLYSLGAKLKFETGAYKGFKAGAAFYSATDLGINRDDIRAQNPLLPPSTLSNFGEAYLQYENPATLLKFGRQKIDTPFMNPSDAHMAPVTYFGYLLENKSFENFELTAIHVTEIKLRQNDSFDNTGKFLTQRLGFTTPVDTTGTTVLGVSWEKDNLKIEGWDYYLPDLFNLIYFQTDFKFAETSGLQPFLSIQIGKQFDVGQNLLGNVNAMAYGLNLGAKAGRAKLAYAFNYLPKNEGNFRNGGLLSPYSFATDALFTNSIDGGLTLKDSAFVGVAHKWTANFEFSEAIWSELSYTYFDLIKSVGGVDSREINIDLIYKFQGAWKGLSLRNRLAFVESGRVAENVIENRLQAQYLFDISP
jgi:hypothetical protein